MTQALIQFAVQRRWLVVAAALFIAGLGLYQAQQLPIDAVPDITNIQVQINSEASGYSPLEAEQRISYIIETAMAGLPNLDHSRSLSSYGLSQVTLVFIEGTDIYWARQQIAERLQALRSRLPNDIEPSLGPIASGLGEIFTYAVEAEANARKPDGTAYNAMDLREIQDWIIRPQLMKVAGITEINSLGGYPRQYQIAPNPGQLLAYKITLEDLIQALQNNNQNLGAGYLETHGEQWLIRVPGQLHSLADIANLVISKRDDAPVRIKDVAKVSHSHPLRTGAATYNGKETVQGTAFMLLGENSRIVAQAVAKRLIEINRSLPQGVTAKPLYDRTKLVNKTLATVKKNLFEGAVLVIVVLFLLLGNIRAALITALIIPLSMLFAIIGMANHRVSGNLMSLGAIDFGLLVDGAVIVVENALRRLGLAQEKLGRTLSLNERLQEVTQSTLEVFNPAVFGLIIIMLVYLPIFALTGVEGKMFQPMAFTVIAALLGALIFSVTLVPAAVAILVKGRVKEKENSLMLRLQRLYRPLLTQALARPGVLLLLAVFLVSLSLWQSQRLGSEFMPQLDEHDIAMHALRIPGTGLQQSVDMQRQLETLILEIPEVDWVFSKIGTPEIATDPMPPSVADTLLILKPRNQWPEPNKPKAQLLNELRALVTAMPGNNYEFTQPIEMRFNELIAGVRADVALRIYGDDLSQLVELAQQAEQLLRQIPGGQDLRSQQLKGLPMLSIEPQRDHLALLGLDVADVQQTVRAASSGLELGLIYQGDRRFPLILRMDENSRNDPEQLAQLPILLSEAANPELSYVPLGEVAEIRKTQGPNQINRRDGKRFIVVSANVEGRDLGSYVAEAQQLINQRLALPPGYWLEFGGTFEQLQSANARLSLLIPLTLGLILLILFSLFGSLRDALIIFTGVPLALTGGVLALSLRDLPLSTSAMVGFIALSGIAVLNGTVMLSFIRQLRNQGLELMQAIQQGAQQRLRPVLMTALVASLGFLPMAFNTGTGAEVQRPLASVVIGGIISSTLLTLVVLPGLYLWVHRRR